MTGGASAEIVITRRSSLGVAPEAFVFEITNFVGFDTTGPSGDDVYDPRHHDLYYFWDFDDAYTFAAPDNIPTVHKNAGIAYGPWVSHTYRSTGTYEPTCLIVEPSSGKSCMARLSTTTMTVGDPNTQFATTNTIFMSPSGNFSQVAGLGYTTVTGSNITSVITSGYNIRSQQTVPKRIMLNRGEAYTFTGYRHGLNPGEETPSLHIVAGPGGDARPEVTCTGGYTWNDFQNTGSIQKDFVAQNINWTDPVFDAEDPAFTQSSLIFFGRQQKSPHHLLLDQCNFSGFGILTAPATPGDTSAVMLNDCIITNWSGYGLIESNYAAYTITGCKFVSPPNAYVNTTQGGGTPIRSGGGGGTALTIIDACDVFNRQGSEDSTQPCLRLNTSGNEGDRTSVHRCALEGGQGIIALGATGANPALPANAIIDKNYLVGGYKTVTGVDLVESGVTIRNNIFIYANSQGRANVSHNNPSNFVNTSAPGSDPDALATPIKIYSNTCVNRVAAALYPGSPANASNIGSNPAGYSTFVVANNINHQTDITTPVVADAPLAQSANDFFTPREVGYRSTVADYRSTTATLTTAGMFDTYAPLPGSTALGDALNGPVAYDDFYGNVRPQYPSRGAYEIAS